MNKHQRYELTAKGRARKRRYRRSQLAKGLCVGCTRKHLPGTTRCEVHTAQLREWSFLNP